MAADPHRVYGRSNLPALIAHRHDEETQSKEPPSRLLLPSSQTEQQSQRREPARGTESRGWSSEADLIINIQENVDADSRSPSIVSIFRVPNFLKDSKRDAYVPKRVSLGPYHHRSAELRPMDNHKGRALRRMMIRFNRKRNLPNIPNNMDFYFSAKDEILELENEIRNNYEEKIDCEAENLALMLCLDGCFILEILRTLGGDKFLEGREASNSYEPVFDINKIDFTGFDFLNDILMLENQIPLNVLRKLLELELGSVDNVPKKLFNVLVEATSSKFYPFKYDIGKWSLPDERYHHLLDLLHSLIVYGAEHADQIDRNVVEKALNGVRRIPRAVELGNSGIKFALCDGGIQKIKFERKSAVIYLPPINITNHTEVLFRNLIAFEACKASEINYVTCYLSLMDELIDSEEDVAVLRRSDIVINYLGSDSEVAELFNGLCKGVTVSRTDALAKLKEDVDDHYRSKFKVWFTELMKEHFSSPWRSLALAGAILALLLTAVQTIYAILSYN